MEVVVTTGAIRHAKLQSDCHHSASATNQAMTTALGMELDFNFASCHCAFRVKRSESEGENQLQPKKSAGIGLFLKESQRRFVAIAFSALTLMVGI